MSVSFKTVAGSIFNYGREVHVTDLNLDLRRGTQAIFPHNNPISMQFVWAFVGFLVAIDA